MRRFPSVSIQVNLVLLILFITTINFLDRSSISFAILPLEKTFNLTNQDFGFIGSAFGIGYLMMCFFAGILVDRFGTFKTWAISAIIWSLSTLFISQAKGFWSLFSMRLILGVAEAVHFPALLKTIIQWLEPDWRSRSISLGLLGVPVASVIGAPLLSYLIEAYSWQVMFITLGILGFIWALLWSLFFWRNVKVHTQILNLEPPKPQSYRQMLSSRLFLGNCINYFIFAYIIFFALVWLPGYLEQTFKENILKTGGLVMFPWASGCLFLVLGGWLSDHLWKKTGSMRVARVYPIGLGMLLSGLSFFAIGFSNALEYDILFLSMGLGFAFLVNSPMYSLNADLFKENSGKAQGLMCAFFAAAGIISPALTGWLITTTGNYKSAIYLVAILSLLSCLISLGFQRPPKRS